MLNTAQKINFAKKVLLGLKFFGIKPNQKVTRKNITFDLDINEGIDLSLFLFGSFQKDVISTVKKYVKPNSNVIDVGANIGAIALFIAGQLSNGRVYALEPTDYAFEKLIRNISLNSDLEKRIEAIQVFVTDGTNSDTDKVAYSSWLLNQSVTSSEEVHPVHKGSRMPVNCSGISLDEFVKTKNLTSLSLIKIDTDGHEFSILNGAVFCLETLRPIVIFEACEYLLKSPNPEFTDFEKLFFKYNYTICEAGSQIKVDGEYFIKICPKGGSVDLLAIPNEKLIKTKE